LKLKYISKSWLHWDEFRRPHQNRFGTIFAMAIKLRFAASLSIFPINKEEVIGNNSGNVVEQLTFVETRTDGLRQRNIRQNPNLEGGSTHD
jgi:hypothetical protein